MTATATLLEPTTTATAPGDWNAAFAALKTRYPNAKDSIVFCINAIQNNPDIALDDLKAQAAMHGIRVTAASANAAQRLMAAPATTTPTVLATAADAKAARSRPPRRVRAAEPELDAEALIRNVVGKLQSQGNAEAEKLREAIRKAVAVLQAAVG